MTATIPPTARPAADRRLKPIDDRLAGGHVKVLSVDVFDTLLWRRVAEPRDVFLLLGARLRHDGRLAGHVSAIQFAELRHEAERKARARRESATGSREIVLADIYREFPDGMFTEGFTVAARPTAELALERGLMCRDDAVVDVMRRAKAAGARVILVSDTYFGAAEIEGFLSAAGVEVPIDRLVVSCEAGRPKWRDLFSHLIRDLGIAPGDMIHLGDNPDADILPCQRLGIPAVHYDKWAFGARTRDRETPAALPARAAMIADVGDLGLTGLRSRLYHRAPPAVAPEHELFWRYGAATVAPVLASFARWVVRSAARTGAPVIYGLMREGRFLKRLIEATADHMGVALKVEELWVSRRAVIRAAFAADALDLLTEFVLLTPGRNTAEILANMGLSSDLLEQVDRTFAGFDVSQPNALLRLCDAIATHGALRERAFSCAAGLKRTLMAGLGKVIDLAGEGPLIVVDLGYMATIQTVLARILAEEKVKRPLIGLYLALNDKAIKNVLDGVDLRGYLSHDGFSGRAARILTRTPDVLEHACMCAAGSLSHFDQMGMPVLLANQRSAKQLAEMAVLQDGIMAGAAAINALLGDRDDSPAASAALQRMAASIIETAMLYPTAQEAAAIGAWKHEAKVDAMPALALNDAAIDLVGLEYGGWPVLQDAGRDHVYWPAAAFARLGSLAGEAYAQGTSDAYGPDHLDSGPMLGAVSICPDIGIGFDERRQGSVALKTNAFGRGQMSLGLKAEGPEAYVRLHLRWPTARAVVRLDRATATFTVNGVPRSVDIPNVQWAGAHDLGKGEFLIERGETVLDLAAHIPPQPHALDLELRFKYLRLDPLFAKS